jgi:hypothetical protein
LFAFIIRIVKLLTFRQFWSGKKNILKFCDIKSFDIPIQVYKTIPIVHKFVKTFKYKVNYVIPTLKHYFFYFHLKILIEVEAQWQGPSLSKKFINVDYCVIKVTLSLNCHPLVVDSLLVHIKDPYWTWTRLTCLYLCNLSLNH